jgi:hypothetical protein
MATKKVKLARQSAVEGEALAFDFDPLCDKSIAGVR